MTSGRRCVSPLSFSSIDRCVCVPCAARMALCTSVPQDRSEGLAVNNPPHDTHTQIFDQCVASANSAYPAVRLGLQQYLALGADPQKLVLGTSDKQKQMINNIFSLLLVVAIPISCPFPYRRAMVRVRLPLPAADGAALPHVQSGAHPLSRRRVQRRGRHTSPVRGINNNDANCRLDVWNRPTILDALLS